MVLVSGHDFHLLRALDIVFKCLANLRRLIRIVWNFITPSNQNIFVFPPVNIYAIFSFVIVLSPVAVSADALHLFAVGLRYPDLYHRLPVPVHVHVTLGDQLYKPPAHHDLQVALVFRHREELSDSVNVDFVSGSQSHQLAVDPDIHRPGVRHPPVPAAVLVLDLHAECTRIVFGQRFGHCVLTNAHKVNHLSVIGSVVRVTAGATRAHFFAAVLSVAKQSTSTLTSSFLTDGILVTSVFTTTKRLTRLVSIAKETILTDAFPFSVTVQNTVGSPMAPLTRGGFNQGGFTADPLTFIGLGTSGSLDFSSNRKVIPFVIFASTLVSWDACTVTQHESGFAEAAFCWFQSTGVLSIGIQTSGGTTGSARSVLSIFVLTFQRTESF